MGAPLDGIRVLDFSHALAGPFGTMLLADMGAEVVCVERVDLTEETRGPGPYVNGRSAFRLSLDRGKRSVQIDLASPRGRELALGLAERSDVLAENFTPGVMERLGLGYEDVRARNPRIVYASISGFGSTGPYAQRGALDIIAQAMSGLMGLTGDSNGPPMRVGASVGDTVAGVHMATGVLAALHERHRSGLGQRLEVSMVESLLCHLENAVARYSATGQAPVRTGSRHPLLTPFQPFPTADGWVAIAGVRDWAGFCAVLERMDLADDPRFEDNDSRTAHHGALEPELAAALRRRPTGEWLELMEGICLAAPVLDMAQVVADPHLQEREAFARLPVPGPEERSILTPRSPVRLSRSPLPHPSPAPSLGADTDAVLGSLLGLGTEELAGLRTAGVIGPAVPGRAEGG